MKTPSLQTVTRSAFAVLAGALLISTSAQAAVSGINTPGTSFASINFDDTASIAPPAGVTNITPTVLLWNGASFTMPLTTDPNTADFAKGNISGTFAGNNYFVSLNSVLLNQPGALTTGSALLEFQFNIEFQLDAAGLPSQATLFPNFIVNGTVQTPAGSFASVGGFIDYYAVNTAGTLSVIETVNYGQTWNTPGSFSTTTTGTPVNGTTPALVGNTTLTLVGDIRFIVDPASISVESEPVPEPSTWAMLLTGAGVVASRIFRRKI